MKLLSLDLQAYGPFTGRELDLSAGSEGVHVVFGRNEAGKSSALRALIAWLYGVPERTSDDFVHAKKELSVGGRLRYSDSEELTCYRKKGRKNTLRDADGKPLDESLLARALMGVDEQLFRSRFGINREVLIAGGKTLLDEQGREAEALFGSSVGSAQIHALVEGLQSEAEKLFKPSGSNPTINALLSESKSLRKARDEASLKPRDWEAARKELERADEALRAAEKAQIAHSKQEKVLQRIRRSLPALARRARSKQALAELGEVPALPADFAERRKLATEKMASACAERKRLSAEIERRTEEAGALKINAKILGEAQTINDLRDRRLSFRRDQTSLPALVESRKNELARATRLLEQLRPGASLADFQSLRPVLARRRGIEESGTQGAQLRVAAKRAREELEDVASSLKAERTRLDTLSPPPEQALLVALRSAVKAAGGLAQLTDSLAKARRKVVDHERKSERDLAGLGLWRGDLEALGRAALPLQQTVSTYVERFRECDERIDSLARERTQAEEERARLHKDLREIELAGAVPTENELEAARARRDAGWQLLRRQWIDAEDVSAEARRFAGDQALADAYPDAVEQADEVADRLRREAQAVHEAATARASLESAELRLTRLADSAARAAEERDRLDNGWNECWSPGGITPLSAREMMDWLSKAEALRGQAAQGDDLRADRDDLERQVNQHDVRLIDALVAIGDEPAQGLGATEDPMAVLQRAQRHLEALEASALERQRRVDKVAELEVEHDRRTRQLERAEREVEDWRATWLGLTRELKLAGDVSSKQVTDHIETIASIAGLLDEVTEKEAAIELIKVGAAKFVEDTARLLESVVPELAADPPEEALNALSSMLEQQIETKGRYDALTAQREKDREALGKVETDIQVAQVALAELCRQAGCNAPEELEPIEQRFAESVVLKQRISSDETELLNGGDGLSLDALIEEAGAAAMDTVIAGIETLERQLRDELKPALAKAHERKIEAERAFLAMDSGNQASEIAAELEQCHAEVRTHAAQYLKLRFARRILNDEVERYRREHRGPVLTRAGEYFRQVTCGAFLSVQTGFDDEGQAVLVAVRESGERLRVEAMSTGTRDQLYLSLRLATLDHRMEASEAMPFVVDDILVQFDDARAKATLQALTTFSAKAQVVLFTHHGRVVDHARELKGAPEGIFVYEL